MKPATLKLFTTGEAWYVARDREHLHQLLTESWYDAGDADDLMEDMRELDVDATVQFGWFSDDLPAWASMEGATVEKLDEPFGAGWDCHVSGPAGLVAQHSEPGLIASMDY